MTSQTKSSKSDIAQRVWSTMCDLVLDNNRRREVSDALGMNFIQIRAIWRIAHGAMTMGELAALLGIDAPYATLVVDALENQGFVERQLHPTDRRIKLVVATSKGHSVAERGLEIWGRPPDGFSQLSRSQLEEVARLLETTRG